MPKVKVNEDVCIGCSTCENLAPDVFKVTDGVSKVQKGFDYEENKDKIEDAIDQCPVQAISIEEEKKEK